MIIKKPYAFMIKHFRLIHVILSLLMVFLISKTSSIVSFFNEYVKNGYYTLNSGSYINFYMFISIILIIVISAFVYLLMKWKNKSRNLYIFTIGFYFVLFILFIVYFNVFSNISLNQINVRGIRAYRDIIIIAYVPQYILLAFHVIRAVGFDIKKFDFKKDLEELDIAEEDQEEIEVTLGSNAYKYKRTIRKMLREFKYYVLENKFFFGTICGVLSLVVFFLVYLRVSVFNKTYKENTTFSVDGIVFKVDASYVTDIDYGGNNILKNKRYVVVKVNMENTNSLKTSVDVEKIRLVLDDKIYNPVYSKGDFLVDLGENFTKNTVLLAGHSYKYIVVFEIPSNLTFNNAKFRLLQDVSIINGDIASKYKEVNLDVKELFLDKEVNVYKMNDVISLKNTTLKNSEVSVISYEINDSFVENYKYTVNGKTYDGKKIIKPDVMGKNDRTILKLTLDKKIDESLYINKYLKTNSDFIKYFGNISYNIDGYVKNPVINVISLDINTNNVYIEVPREITNSSSIDLILIVRNNQFLINLY